MATLDVFTADGFTAADMTREVNKADFLPTLLGSMPGLFEPDSITTTIAQIEEMDGTLALVPSQERGGPGQRVAREKRRLISLDIPHLPAEDRIHAHEVQGIRAFGSATELMQVQELLNRRNLKLRRNLELTLENFRLGAVKGIVYDSDGSTVLLNAFTAFNVTQPTEVDFDLDNGSPASGVLRKTIVGTQRTIDRALKQASNMPGLRYVALCGDTFFDQFIAHQEVRETVKEWSAAVELRTDGRTDINFGGVRWINYRGTDDNSTVAVAATKCHLFPVGVPGLFREIYAPANYIETVNTPGLPFYAKQAPDERFNKYVDLEVQSNPLMLCTQPGVLVQGKNT